MKLIVALCFAGVAAIAITRSAAAEGFQIEEASIAGIHQAFQDKSLTCHQLVQAYLDRIAAYDHNGPALNAIQRSIRKRSPRRTCATRITRGRGRSGRSTVYRWC